MLRKIVKAIKTWINREIQAYKIEQEKKVMEERIKRNKADFTELMRCGNVIRGEDKDDGSMKAVVVDYVGRGGGGGRFNPVFSRTDCLNWAERSNQHAKTNPN